MGGITLDQIDANLQSIKISDGTNDLGIAADGSIAITDNGGSLTVDGTVAATQSGTWDIGTLTGITNDVNIADGGNSITVDAADLDIRDLVFATDSVTAHQGGSWSIATVPDAYDTWKISAVSATSTVGEIAATPLADRIKMIIQNLGSQDAFIGPDNTVVVGTGTKIPKGGSGEFLFSAVANVWAITASGSADLRISEYAA